MNDALGWTLFHFLWEGAAIALALAIAMQVISSARVRYAASCVAMLAMLVAFAVTLAVKLPGTNATGGIAVHVPAGVLTTPLDAPESTGFASAKLPYSWAVPIWLAGVVLLSLHRLLAFAAAYRLRRVGVCGAPAPWPERLGRLASRLGVTRPVLLLESCLAEVPAAAGYLRPAILLPVGLLAGLPAQQVEFILIHELAHIARRDYLVNLLQSVVEALLFYHPAVWWVSGLIRNEREHCCDDVMVALAGDPRGYAAALVGLEQGRVPQPALAATGGSLTRRVRRLLRQPAASQSFGTHLAAAALVALIVSVVLVAGQPEQIASPKVVLAHPEAPALVAQAAPAQQIPSAQPEGTPLHGPYRKWMNEDVAYIITDAERQAFKQLPSDAEREKFIEQFWLRRDPTPDTVENEFKEEHYRRIAYTNEHFASGIPGWKTDRGRVYITYGPPDEIEDHADGGTYQRPAAEGGGSTSVFPFQQWRYKYIEGIGKDIIVEFVDRSMNGEYRMTTDPSEKDALRYLPGAAGNHPNVVALRKKIAGEQGATNHFVANEPGGKVTVSVTGGSTRVSVPLPSSGTFQVLIRVTDQSGRHAAGLEDKVSGRPLLEPYTAAFTLGPGSYTLGITIKNAATGEVSQESVYFYVSQ